MVPRREGNEAEWEGRQGVGAPHWTAEAGEPSPEGPRGGKGVPGHGGVGVKDDGHEEV